MLRSSDDTRGYIIDGGDPGDGVHTTGEGAGTLDPENRRALHYAEPHNVWRNIKRMHGPRGLLEVLLGMPLDVLFEIFGHLNPLDVLHLARTTKALREILMRRSALSVWKHSLSNVEGLPACPNDLNEPQWTSLVYETLCHYCWKMNTPNIVWMNRTRCCKKCNAENFSDSLHYDLPREVVPTSNINSGKWIRQQYCLRTAAKYMKEYSSLTGQAREEWCTRKKAEIQTRRKHAEQCEIWNRTRVNELDVGRQKRYASIKQRLTELGWGDEIKKLNSNKLYNHKLVRQTKGLTDDSWNEMKPILIALMEEIKAERIVTERRMAQTRRQHILSRIHEEYVASQPLHSIIPAFADFVMIEKFKSIIEDTPVEKEVTAEHFQQAMSELPSLIDTWRQSKNLELLELMKASPNIGPGAEESMLHLATTFFHCTSCRAEVQHPRILIHACTTSLRYSENVSSPYFFDLGCEPWNYGGKRVSFHETAHRAARSILTACGFDPDVTTTQQIRDVNPLIECQDCSNEKQGTLVMRWSQAVTHAISHQRCDGECGQSDSVGHGPHMRLATLDEKDTKLVVKLEEASRGSTSKYAALWSCVRCKKKTNLNNLRHHIRLTKNLTTEPVEAEDYVRHLDAPGYPQPVRIKQGSSEIPDCDPDTCDGRNCGDRIRCEPTAVCNGTCGDSDSGCSGSGCGNNSKCADGSDCDAPKCGEGSDCDGGKCDSTNLTW